MRWRGGGEKKKHFNEKNNNKSLGFNWKKLIEYGRSSIGKINFPLLKV